jgi:hypothetical protein
MLACRPGIKADADARDYHHLMQHALTEIVGHLKQVDTAGAEQEAVMAFDNEDD